MRFVVLTESSERWIWEIRTAEGIAICRSAMSYGSRDLAYKAVYEVRDWASQAPVLDSLITAHPKNEKAP